MHYVIVDIETTGGNPKDSKITEIALYKTDGNVILDEYVTLVNPGIPIPDFIVNLTGINNDMVKDAPPFYEIAKTIVEFSEGCVFVAHNVGFDYGVIRHEFKSLGYDYRRPQLCTVIASRSIIPGYESYSLGKLSRNLGIHINGRHRAGGDALATTELFHILHEKNHPLLISMIKKEVDFSTLNPNIDATTLEELPAKIGVYKFYNEHNQLIFVGRTKNIRKKVIQHLKNTKTKKGNDLIQSSYKIDYEATGSELIAAIVECQLLHKYHPKFNKSVRKNTFTYGLYLQENPHDFHHVYIDSTNKVTEEAMMYFSTKKEAYQFLNQSIANKIVHPKRATYNVSTAQTELFSEEELLASNPIEAIFEYNAAIQSWRDKLSLSAQTFLVVDFGRNRNERSIVMVKNGSFHGFGFIPSYLIAQPASEWTEAITIQYENFQESAIIQNYLQKNPTLTKINL